MNQLADPFKQLIERRLWPIALVLLAALVAVPVLLGKDAEPEVVPTATTAPVAADVESAVTLADGAHADDVRAVLGDRKDPFRPAVVKRAPKPVTIGDDGLGTGTGAGAGAGSETAPTGGDGGTTTTGGGTSTPAAPTATPAPKPTFDLYSLKVRFGSTDGELVTRNVKRLTGLPGGTHPAALYLGLLENHKSAVFIIDAGVKVLGDGHCDPTPEDCQTLTLKKGETEFLTRGDKQWELDLIDIHVKKTTDAQAAKASRKTIAPAGREKLRSLVSRVGDLRYYESTGDLREVPKAAASKKVGRSTRFTSTG